MLCNKKCFMGIKVCPSPSFCELVKGPDNVNFEKMISFSFRRLK